MYRDILREVTGSRPSVAVGNVLDRFMLPHEPVTAALRGTMRMMPVWVVATPAVIVVVRDGMSPSVEAIASPGEHIAWQAQEGWSDAKLHLELNENRLTLSQVHPESLGFFLSRIESMFGTLFNGFPPLLQEVLEDIEMAHRGAVAAAPLDDPLDLQGLVSRDVQTALVSALTSVDELTFELGLLLFVTRLTLPDVAQFSRRGVVEAALADRSQVAAAEYATVRRLAAAKPGSRARDGWADAVAGISCAATHSMTLLAPRSAQARSRLFDIATDLESRLPEFDDQPSESPPPVNPEASSASSESVIDQLERLDRLRASGVLTDSEFASLKAKALGL